MLNLSRMLLITVLVWSELLSYNNNNKIQTIANQKTLEHVTSE